MRVPLSRFGIFFFMNVVLTYYDVDDLKFKNFFRSYESSNFIAANDLIQINIQYN